MYYCLFYSHKIAYGIENLGFPCGTVVKNLPVNARDMGWIPQWGRSPGEGNGNPIQYCCLGNPMDKGAWQATVPGVTKSWTHLSNWAGMHTHTHTHIPWKVPNTTGRFRSMRNCYNQETFMISKLLILRIWQQKNRHLHVWLADRNWIIRSREWTIWEMF